MFASLRSHSRTASPNEKKVCLLNQTLSLKVTRFTFSAASLCRRTPDSFTCFCPVCSAFCAHSDRIALFRIFPPDCPNKPEQTGRRQRGDVTHSSEPWRLSAWRRSGGLHGDVKQEGSHSSIHLRECCARSPENKPALGLLSFIYHLKAAGPDYRPAHLQSRRCQPETEEEEEGPPWFCYRI